MGKFPTACGEIKMLIVSGSRKNFKNSTLNIWCEYKKLSTFVPALVFLALGVRPVDFPGSFLAFALFVFGLFTVYDVFWR